MADPAVAACGMRRAAHDAATAMKITAQDLLRLGIIDSIVPEATGGAHRDRQAALNATGDAIARALAGRPALVFADEPTGNLDRATGHAIMDLLFERRAATRATLLVITHDPALAERCDRVVELADGRIARDSGR